MVERTDTMCKTNDHYRVWWVNLPEALFAKFPPAAPKNKPTAPIAKSATITPKMVPALTPESTKVPKSKPLLLLLLLLFVFLLILMTGWLMTLLVEGLDMVITETNNCVINDPFSHIHCSTSSNHYFHLIRFGLQLILKSGDGRTDNICENNDLWVSRVDKKLEIVK